MIVIPKDTPLITELNSYYLNIDKLFEHYQGLVDGGCIYFKSPSSEGSVFFDNENLINGIYNNKNSIIHGKEAINLLMEESRSKNYSISLYEISPDRITYWANIINAEILHKDLSTEFTDLEGLIKKMISEKLTGYIDVTFNVNDKAVVFLLNGEFLGLASHESRWQLVNNDEIKTKLINKSRKIIGLLNVMKIPLNQIVTNYTIQNIKDNIIKTSLVLEKDIFPVEEVVIEKPLNIIEMLQHLLIIYEKFIIGNKRIKEDFDTILKRKFMEKIDIYDFLDPFAAEFKYSNGKIKYSGNVDNIKLAIGLIDCLKEISIENDMQKWLIKHIGPWQDKYSEEIKVVKIDL